MELFESKIKYSKIDESGKEKKVSETNLFDSITFGECENRTIEECSKHVTGITTESIVSIKRSRITKVIRSGVDGDVFFEVTIVWHHEQENGKIRKQPEYWMIENESIEKLLKELKDELKDSVVAHEISASRQISINEIYLKEI